MQQIISFVLVGLAINALTAHSFTPSLHNFASNQIVSGNIINSKLHSMQDDDYPSDYDPEDLESVEKKVSVDMVSKYSHYLNYTNHMMCANYDTISHILYIFI